MILTQNQPFLRELFEASIERQFTKNLMVIANTNSKGAIIGAVGYDDWNGASCRMHMWGRHKRWATPQFMHTIFHYPFEVVKCKVVLVEIASHNEHSLDIAKRVGFRTECVLAGAHPDGALHILSMYKDNCIWLERQHGIKVESTAPA